MNSTMMGALSGAAGGLSKYGEIQGEQRKYNMDQKKIQAETLRKENFARFQHDLSQSARGSGMVSNVGQEYTKAELEGLPEGERTSALSKYDYQEGVKTRQAEKTAGKKKQAKGQEISKEWTTSTGDPITNQEAEKLLETPEGRQQLMNRLERDVAKEERVATVKGKATSAKDKKAVESNFRRSVTSANKQTMTGTEAEKVDVILAEVDNFQDDPIVMNLPQVQNAQATRASGELINQMFKSGKSKSQIESEMKADGASPKQIKDAMAYADFHAEGATGPDVIFGKQGKGR